MKKIKEFCCKECAEAYETCFSKFEQEHLDRLFENKMILFFRKGELIFEEAGISQGLFCIREGKIKIYKNGPEGREHITRIAFPGELVGLKALLTKKPYTVSASALEDTILCNVDKKEFYRLLEAHPEFMRALTTCLSNMLVTAEARILSLAHKPVRERLAEILVYMNKHLSHPNSGKKTNYLNLTRQDLANMIGTAQETVIRFLAEFKEQGLIAVDGRKIFIRNEPELTKIANGFS